MNGVLELVLNIEHIIACSAFSIHTAGLSFQVHYFRESIKMKAVFCLINIILCYVSVYLQSTLQIDFT